jgi:hypothetical protein
MHVSLLEIVNQRIQPPGFASQGMELEEFPWVLVTDVDPWCLKTRLASGTPIEP